ncbi:polysaccharide deacetylase family protein [Colwelliaceae bacterium BS250]
MSISAQVESKELTWPGGRQVAISLSYDDALNSQLDHAIPALDVHNIKASFYVLPNSPAMSERMLEWKAAAKRGHELGNHSIYHPCRASLPNREWVPAHHDLDKYSVAQMVEEVTTANTFLKALDGKTERTFTVPCGDTMKGDVNYLSQVKDHFIAIKGQGIEKGYSVIWAPADVTGKELVDYIKNVPKEISLINIIFHGVGGDYLSVSAEAHAKLLSFLVNNNETYYVDSFINIMKFANTAEH